MPIIGDEDAVEIRKMLEGMVDPVRLIHFTQELNLEYGLQTRELLSEVVALSPKISLEVFNFQLDRERVAEYGIERVPATAVRNGKDRGIRFYGVPAGYEFSNLLDAILMVSKNDSGLSAATREKLAALTSPLHLEVFVTPT